MDVSSDFVGYDQLTVRTRILDAVPSKSDPAEVQVVLERTPFYPEGGGQVADGGLVTGDGVELEVVDVQLSDAGGPILHTCRGRFDGGPAAEVEARVDAVRRQATARNHTGVHLMVAALAELLDGEPRQAGSRVCADSLRFDFESPSKLDADDIARIEDRVNDIVLQDLAVSIEEVSHADAVDRGISSSDPSAYGEVLRLVCVGEFSRELCGGTHVAATGELGSFRITQQLAMGKGLRRLHGVTGAGALALARRDAGIVAELRERFSASAEEIVERVASVLDEKRELAQELGQARAELLGTQVRQLARRARATAQGVPAVVEQVEVDSPQALNRLVDALQHELGEGLVLAGACTGTGKVSLAASASPGAVAAGLSAGDVAKQAAEACGGKGGGRPQRAQAGGREIEKLPGALQAVRATLGIS